MFTQISKYWQLFIITWENGFAYPISVLFWRLRQFLATFMALTIWTVIFVNQQNAFGYSRAEMITFIFIVGVLQSLILASVLGQLSEQIYTGQITYQLMMPLNMLWFFVSQDLADKLKNFAFMVVETLILFAIFKPEVVFPPLPLFLIFLLTVFLGAAIMFFIMLLFGVIGFWSPETWGPRFLFYMFLDFTAGKLFPLNILPLTVQRVLAFTPFPYLSYVQTQIFLGKFDTSQIGQTVVILFGWVIILALLFRYFWTKGLREYGAVGH